MFWLALIVGAVVFVVIVIVRMLEYARRATVALEKLAARPDMTFGMVQPFVQEMPPPPPR